MEIKGRYTLPASPDAVWAALNDPQVLSGCIPGCEGVEKINDREFWAAASVKVGGVKARLSGRVTISEADPPSGCKLLAEGQGVAGFMKGSAKLRLVPAQKATILSYETRVSASGRLAQAGNRALASATKSFSDDFFTRLAAHLDSQAHPPVHDQTSMVPESRSADGQQSVVHASMGLAPQIWVAGLVSVVVILLILFGMVL